VFICHNPAEFVILAVYVDDVLLTGSDTSGTEKANAYFKAQFVTKDMRT